MARRRTKAAREAQALLVWLESLELPTRVINALRRDLEVIIGEREGEDGGVLMGFDQARFTEELYRPRGGQVGRVATVAKSAIEALRAAIPSPVSGDPIEATQPAQGDEEPAAQESAEVALPAQGAAAAPAPDPTPEPAPADDAAAAAEALEPIDDTVQEAAAPADVPAAPRRRGRPPRAAAAGEAEAAPADVPAAPAKRRGRPPRDETASDAAADLPPRTRRARVAAAIAAAQPAAPLVEVLAPTPLAPTAAPPVADPSFAVLLRLWRELHPQGRRAATHYMAGLLAEM